MPSRTKCVSIFSPSASCICILKPILFSCNYHLLYACRPGFFIPLNNHQHRQSLHRRRRCCPSFIMSQDQPPRLPGLIQSSSSSPDGLCVSGITGKLHPSSLPKVCAMFNSLLLETELYVSNRNHLRCPLTSYLGTASQNMGD
jgi:hypothetical protein